MTYIDAQENMRDAYLGGGPGMLVSGIVWLIAGLVGFFVSVQASVFTLFIGGMFIFPSGQQLSKLLGRSGAHNQDNPLRFLALESTFLLFIGIFLAFVIVQFRSELFFPIMLMIIGGRYLTFQTIYGMRVYWVIGGLLAIAGGLTMALNAPFVTGAFIGGGTEVIGSFILMRTMRANEESSNG